VNPTIQYMAMDGERLTFDVPKGINRSLVVSAIKKMHQGQNPDLAVRGLTRPEVALLLNIVESLQKHSIPEAV
jgi:hypothetical protein